MNNEPLTYPIYLHFYTRYYPHLAFPSHMYHAHDVRPYKDEKASYIQYQRLVAKTYLRA